MQACPHLLPCHGSHNALVTRVPAPLDGVLPGYVHIGVRAWPHAHQPQLSQPNAVTRVECAGLASPKNRRNLLRQAVFPLLISACEGNQKTWVK
jgi:hypothetical protein